MKRVLSFGALVLFWAWGVCFNPVGALAASITQEVPGDALPESAFPGDGGCMPIMTAYGKLFGVACGIGGVSFTLHSPEDWEVDWKRSKLTDMVYYTLGSDDADKARAVIYAHARKAAPGNQEEAAQARARESLQNMLSIKPEGGSALREAKPYAAKNGNIFALRFFDKVPGTKSAAVEAYQLHKGVLFVVALAAADDAVREAVMPEFKEALNGVMINGVVSGEGVGKVSGKK